MRVHARFDNAAMHSRISASRGGTAGRLDEPTNRTDKATCVRNDLMSRVRRVRSIAVIDSQ